MFGALTEPNMTRSDSACASYGEQLFRRLDALREPPTAEQVTEMAAPYGCDVDPEGTRRVIERHGLTF